jgi:hypothetical protein
MLKTLTTWFITIDEGMVPEAGEVFEKWQQERIKEVQIIHSVCPLVLWLVECHF